MRLAPAVVIGVIAAIGAVRPGAQTPPRDAPRMSESGTAVIAGTVVADASQRPPLRRATISLSRTGVEDIRYTVTDDRGRFQFADLPAGTYTLGASKAGYISKSYGALQPGMPGTSISLRDGQRFAGEPIALARGAVITGRLVDRQNKPVDSSTVTATPITTVNGQRRLRVVSSGIYGRATTNAHGEYRIFGLVAGDYLISAETGGGPAERSITTPELLAWARQPSNAPAPALRQYNYAKTHFPGTADPAAAVLISVTTGEEKAGLDFALQYVPVVRISGVVTDMNGKPAAGAQVWQGQKTRDAIFNAAQTPSTRTLQDGSFSFTNVGPGDWTLTASGVPITLPGTPATPTAPRRRMTQWGAVDVPVSGRDVLDADIRLGPGAQVSGRVIVVNSQDASVAPVDTTKWSLWLASQDSASMEAEGPGVYFNPDGTFTFEDVMPGHLQLRIFRTNSAPGTVSSAGVRSAMLGGRDLMDVPLDVRSGDDISGITVTMSSQMAVLTGTLVDAAGRPTPQFYVFAFPVDRTLWTNGSRRIVAARADVNGIYTIGGLPAGDYYVCALTELDRSQQYDAGYLDLLVPAALKITLAEGEKTTQSLRVGG